MTGQSTSTQRYYSCQLKRPMVITVGWNVCRVALFVWCSYIPILSDKLYPDLCFAFSRASRPHITIQEGGVWTFLRISYLFPVKGSLGLPSPRKAHIGLLIGHLGMGTWPLGCWCPANGYTETGAGGARKDWFIGLHSYPLQSVTKYKFLREMTLSCPKKPCFYILYYTYILYSLRLVLTTRVEDFSHNYQVTVALPTVWLLTT